MNDDRLDQLLKDVMRVEDAPDLWPRIAPPDRSALSWREVRWACAVGLAVLTAWTLIPQNALHPDQDWEPIAIKQRLRAESMTASLER